MTGTATPRRGRPRLAWLTPAEVATLEPGIAVAVERVGSRARTVGRILRADDSDVEIAVGADVVAMPTMAVRRARVLDSPYDAGDPVVRRGVSESTWRGGVVRTDGTDVLVEQIGGAFAWLPEDELEPAESRDRVLPALPRGPVPARIV